MAEMDESAFVIYDDEGKLQTTELPYNCACAFVIMRDLQYHEIEHEPKLKAWYFFCSRNISC